MWPMAAGSAQVRIPLIAHPIAEQRQGSALGWAPPCLRRPYKSGSQGNRRGREASVSEEASEGSVGNAFLGRCYLFFSPPLVHGRDLQLLKWTGAYGVHMSPEYSVWD